MIFYFFQENIWRIAVFFLILYPLTVICRGWNDYMRLKLIYILLLLAFALSVNADNFGYTESKPLLFGIDQNYPPLEYVDEDGNPNGADVELVKQLTKRMNIPVVYKPNKWAAIAGDVMNGKVDLGMMVFSPYRQEQTNYSRAVLRQYYQMLTRIVISAAYLT